MQQKELYGANKGLEKQAYTHGTLCAAAHEHAGGKSYSTDTDGRAEHHGRGVNSHGWLDTQRNRQNEGRWVNSRSPIFLPSLLPHDG